MKATSNYTDRIDFLSHPSLNRTVKDRFFIVCPHGVPNNRYMHILFYFLIVSLNNFLSEKLIDYSITQFKNLIIDIYKYIIFYLYSSLHKLLKYKRRRRPSQIVFIIYLIPLIN